MNVSIFARNKQQALEALVITAVPAISQSDITVLAPGEVAAVAGGPQVKNEPTPP